MIFKILISFLSVLLIFKSLGQTKSDNNYRSPLDIPLTLAANFGELRPNHFHMGVDFKTDGKEGLKLHSIEDGYVSRVKISPYGYGKVVYIDHPNGITSVYAHCSQLKGKLDSMVTVIQQREENFEVEIYFLKNEIPLKKGDVFALSGNTGSSTAPHLHFELRNTKTQEALNPLLHGFNLADHKAPDIRGVKVYALTEEGYRIPGKTIKADVIQSKGTYRLKGSNINVPSEYCSEKGGIGLAFDVVDYFDGSVNVCGLYGSALKKGADTIFCQRIDKVSFADSRYVNSHKDYEEYMWNHRKFHKSFRTENNPLSIYPTSNLGVIHIKPGENFALEMDVFDTKKNKSSVEFGIHVLDGPISKETNPFPANKFFLPDSAYVYHTENTIIEIEPFTFYEPIAKQLNFYDPVRVGPMSAPIQKPISLSLKIPNHLKKKDKLFVEVVSAKGKRHFLESTVEGDFISCSSMYLGEFTIQMDTVPPKVSAISLQKSIMTWSVKESQTELTDYDLYINGKWYPMEYESKGDYFIFRRPKGLSGKHTLTINAFDAVGNKGVWTSEVMF